MYVTDNDGAQKDRHVSSRWLTTWHASDTRMP